MKLMRTLLMTFVVSLSVQSLAPAQFTLSTGFTGTTSFDGNFFDVESITGVIITTLDIHLAAGTHNVEVWAVSGGGTHQGKEANAGLWTMIAQVNGLTSAGINLPTPLGANLNLTVLPGVTQGLYVTVTSGGDVRYNTATTVGALAVQDSNIRIFDGNYGTYPFSPFPTQARRWNGTVYYTLISNNADDLFLQNITAPVNPVIGCTLFSQTETISVSFFNLGSNTIPAGTMIPASYTVTPPSGPPVMANEMITLAAPLAQFGSGTFAFATTADMSMPGVYNISATLSLAGDMDTANDSKMSNVTSGGPVLITTFPWVENFDSSVSNGTLIAPTGWQQETTESTGTNSDWFFRNTTTPTTTTGPTADHTTGVAGQGYYAQVEDAGNFAQVNLRTPCLQIINVNNPTLEFWAHSRNGNTGGASPNFLAVDLLDASGTTVLDILPAIGPIGTDWTRFRVSLAPYQGAQIVQVRFRGQSSGGSTAHDLCVDDVRVFEAFTDDLTVSGFVAPVNNILCGPQGLVEVTVNVTNDGSNTVPAGTMIPMAYTVNGGPAVNETLTLVNPLALGETVAFSFTTFANLTVQGTYTFAATVTMAGDLNAANDTFGGYIVNSGANPATVISTFPWTENFDASISNGSLVAPTNWLQDTSDATGTNSDWFFRSQSPPTTATGPSADHTTGVTGVGYYAHVEDAGNFASVNLLTPCIDLSTLPNPTLSFWVHSNNANAGGASPNFLSIDIIDDQGMVTSNVIPAIGPLGTQWTEFLVDLSPFASVGTGLIRVRFRGQSSGGSASHDVAIDDISVFEQLALDVEVLSIDSPVDDPSNCDPIGLQPITCTLRNVGGLQLVAGSMVPLTYTVNGGAPVNEVFTLVNPLNPTQTVQYTFSTLFNFNAVTSYTIDVSTSFADQNPGNNLFAGYMFQNGITPLLTPFVENFDSVTTVGGVIPPAGWINLATDTVTGSGTEVDWRFRNNDTSSTGTGAPFDHTTGVVNQGYYAYVEDSAGHWQYVTMQSPCISLVGLSNPRMTFYIHSNDDDDVTNVTENFLHVDVVTYPGAVVNTDVIPRIGHLGDAWMEVNVPLQAYAGQVIRVQFRLDSTNQGGNDFDHDICIDDVAIDEGPLAGTNEDFQLRSFINFVGTGTAGFKTANPGDFVTINMSSDGGLYNGFPPILAAQFYNDGSSLAGAFPGIHLNLGAMIVFNGTAPTPLGLNVLGPGGINLNFVAPAGLTALTARIQAIISTPFSNNGIFVSTDAHDIDFN